MNTSEFRAEPPHRPASMRRATRLIAAVAAGLIGISMVGLTALPASADSRPIDPTSPASPVTASSDVLPTVQIDGVVWQQTVIGNTVYAVGQFTTARPAGAAPGVNTTPRNNILAFDIRTGALITSFNASLNAQAKTISASPDGKRVYVGGAFTQVNGVDRRFVAALDSTTGALITSFAPLVNSRVYAVQATENAIYLGGWFSGVGSAKRDKLAAVSPSNAALLPWNPVVAGGDVTSLVVSPDRTKVVAAGNFTSVNGSTNPGAGWAAISASTGALEPWAVGGEIRNSGSSASITGLSADATNVYATGYDYGNVSGAFEGVVAARWTDGSLNWLEDCHGDSYGVWAAESVVYTVGHAHYCGNVGGFPESTPKRSYNHALAFGKIPVGTITNDTQGYRNFGGKPHSALLNFWPTFGIGTYTGQSQATWAVSGNSDYVVMGGEFPTVSGVGQQGLVRFGVGDKSTNNVAPEIRGAAFNPAVLSIRPGEARISWGANWDRDNRNLTYRVFRNGNLTTPIFETKKESTFWQLSGMNFVDKGLEPGTKQSYRVFAVDAFGNEARSEGVDVTIASEGAVSPYASSILDDGASSFWRLGETSGTNVIDWAGFDNLTAGAGVTRGAAGAIAQDTDKASVFSGTETGIASGRTPQESPNTFTSEAWIKTTTTSGGKIIGFGASPTGNSGSYDRQVYMDNAGRLLFGVYTGGTRTLTSPKSYNDGQWHHVVSSLGPGGMALYVDGQLIGKRTDTTRGDVFSGYWRIGGDNLGGWPNQPTSSYFNGTIDDVAVYPKELTRSQIQAHYTASGREVVGPKKPADAYGAAVFGADPDLYWRLDEASGTTAADTSQAGSPGTYVRGITLGRSGALEGVANKAAAFDGSSGLLSSNTRYDNPTTYSQELWFTTTTTNGGKLIGFGDNPNDRSNNYDRHVYMENDGRLTFGVWTGQTNLAQSQAAYNDGKWHHMVATQSSAGMVLYVDGKAVGTNPQTGAQSYSGHWKVGSDNTWGPQPYFAGTIDEVAVYSRALPAAEVSEHFRLGAGAAPVVPNKAPVAAASVTAKDLTVAADGSASSDADGTIASYSWNFGDNTPAESGAKVSHTYAAAGTYQVVLTVTDDKGATNAVTKSVTATAPMVPNKAPVAAATVTSNGLAVLADGSASSDADGQVVVHSWDFGDNTPSVTGAVASHTYARAGTYQVVLTVTDDRGATNAVAKEIVVTAPNAAPTAAATVITDNLTLSADGSASSDVDGTIDAYSWDFGDGTLAGVGAVVSHTYTTPGTYQVVLTVTDDKGASNSVTKPVTVTAPAAPNKAPVAAASVAVQGLQITGDGSASSDPDGTVTAYSWNFGDGTPVTQGPAVSHTYAVAGTYQVALTVTDNKGATNTVTREIVVAAPVSNVLASDDFSRSVTNGLGTAGVGGNWIVANNVASKFGVVDGRGQVQNTVGWTVAANLSAVKSSDTRTRVQFSLDKLADGGGFYPSILGRRIDGVGDYRAKLWISRTGVVTLDLKSKVGNQELKLAGGTIPGLTYVAGDTLNVALDITGEGTTNLGVKVWKEGTPEPGAWQFAASDSTAALQAPGTVGFDNYLSGSSTVAPMFRLDNWRSVSGQ